VENHIHAKWRDMMDKNVVIGLPVVYKISDLYCEESIDLYTEERFLPKILVQIGFFRSNSEVRKNRPDLVVELNELDFIDIRVGKKRLCLTVGNPITNEDETKRLNEMIKIHEEGVK